MRILFISYFILGFFFFFNTVFGVCNFNHSFCFWFVCVLKKVNPIFCVLGNCSNKDPCHMWIGLFWNDKLQTKWTPMPTLVRIAFSKLLHLLSIPTWGGCGVHSPHVMTKLKKDENLASLIWASKGLLCDGPYKVLG